MKNITLNIDTAVNYNVIRNIYENTGKTWIQINPIIGSIDSLVSLIDEAIDSEIGEQCEGNL